jgi:hypothetical protein
MLARMIHVSFSRNGRILSVKREERDSRDEQVRSLPVSLVPPISPVLLESGIGSCSKTFRHMRTTPELRTAHSRAPPP